MSKKSAEYWRERFSQLEKAANIKSQKKAEEIQEQFDRALSEISKKTMVWYQRLADNNVVSLAEAKKLLEQGVSPAETALRTGFSAQSHFTNYFSSFIGLTPGAYREIFLARGVDK